MVTAAQWQASKSLVAQATRPHPSHNIETMMTNLCGLIDVRCAAIYGWEQFIDDAPPIAPYSLELHKNADGGIEVQSIQQRSAHQIGEIRARYDLDSPDTHNGHAGFMEEYKLVTRPHLLIGECRQPVPERQSAQGLMILLHLKQRQPTTELHQLTESILPAIATVSHQYLKRTAPGNNRHIPPLTNRESEVLRHLVSGSGVQVTSKALDVSRRTVRFHLHNIYRKLGVHNQHEALVLTQQMNLIAD